MPARVRHAALVLFLTFYIIPDLCPAPHHALATSLDLKLSSDFTDDDIWVQSKEMKVLRFNYTLNVTGDANHTLALAVCVSVDDLSVARAWVSKNAIVPLHADNTGTFNVTVIGLFVGRAHLHIHFVVGHNESVRCGQPEAKKLQDLLHISQASQGEEMNMNVTKTSESSENSSSVVNLHSGMRYQVIVLRPERIIDQVFRNGILVLVVIINIGMGCKLDLQVVKATLRKPFAPITGLCSQFIIMPLMSFAVTRIFTLTPGVALGFFAAGCSPGGSGSNVFCYFLGGDVSLSITMTFVSTVASIGFLPLWMFTLGRYVANTDEISIPYANIVYSLLGLVLAVGVGLLLKTKKPSWARVALTASKISLGLLIVFMLTVGIYANLYIFFLMKGEVLAAAAILPYAGFLLGGLVAIVLRMPRKNVITIAIETGIQNTGVAMIILLLSLDHPDSDLSIVAPAASSMFTPLPLWIALLIYQTRKCILRGRCCCKKKMEESDDSTASPSQTDEKENAEERNVEKGENTTTTTTKENLCKKLFGESGPCWNCWSDPDKECPPPAGEIQSIEIVVPPKEKSSSPKKPESLEFDNLGLEVEEDMESPRSEDSDGTAAPVEEKEKEEEKARKSDKETGSESALDLAASIRNDQSSTSV